MPKGEIIRLFKECTKPKEQGKPTKKNVVSGNNNVIVMDSKSVNITINKTRPKTIKVLKNSSHIDDHTAYRIKELVDNLVLKETTGGMTSQKAYAKWYGALKKRYKVPSYSLIPSELGEAAISWLMTQAAIKRTKISRSNIPMYRNELYTAIHARAKNLNISKGELYQIVLGVLNKNVSSLTQLNESNLKKLYQYIMHL
ncbi:ORF6C domain-containing protein [Pasteurella multocida]|uniref:ORF6C domain-containing protein n=1 Tax=Pasteurella multocida TaxID=747 RepID=UPI0029B0CA9B|nr:ORF6C domain-containing protein [Pasteurella multocida]MDX3962182.1 ORF6C domain-containing protein [Pasteurella multocida]